jgi:hypothetical protein
MAIVDRRGVNVSSVDPPIAGDPNPGLAIKAPVIVATTGAIVLSGVQTIDGVSVGGNAERVLVKNQADQTTNGIYNASSGNWTRTIDANSNDQFTQGLVVYVAQGTVNVNGLFQLTSVNPIVLGTSLITFASLGIPASRTINTTAPLAGGGPLTSNLTLSLTINGSLQVVSNTLQVAPLAGQTSKWVSSFNSAGVPQLTQPSASDIASGQVLSAANDTNVTLTLGGSPTTSLLTAASLTLGWTGTLAAARLNANVVQGVTNDTNIQGTISAQNLTFAWAGLLAGTRGGTGVNNGASTITIGGNVTFSGAFAATLTTTATTNSTLPAGTHTLGGLDVTQTWSAPQTFSQALLLTGTITPTALAADQNDYNPTGLATASVIRQDGGAADRNITGLTAQNAGTVIFFENIGATNKLVLKDSSASSSAANRFLLGSDITLSQNQSAMLWYDSTSSRWRCLGLFTSAGGGSGTVTSISAGQGAITGNGSGAALTSSGTIYAPAGFANRCRNSGLTSWFHGSGTLTITTSGGWGAEGVYIVPTGASVTAVQIANGLSSPLTVWAQKITGNTSVTDVTVRFVVESYDAAALAGQQVTFQVPVLNNTGGSITPTITVKHANAQDNFGGGTTTDVSAVSLQTITNGSTGTLAYSWSAPAGTANGISIDIDFGNNFSTNGKSIQIGGGFDLRVTPGFSVGTISAPPTPEIPSASLEIAWNERFYETSYDNGTAPGSVTRLGLVMAGSFFSSGTAASQGLRAGFRTRKRAAPSMSTWDGAGTASQSSEMDGTSWSDGQGAVTSNQVGTTGYIVSVSRGAGGAGANAFFHYAADATLTGA